MFCSWSDDQISSELLCYFFFLSWKGFINNYCQMYPLVFKFNFPEVSQFTCTHFVQGKVFSNRGRAVLLWEYHLTNRFHVAVRLFSNRSQMTSKYGKNEKVAHEARSSRCCGLAFTQVKKHLAWLLCSGIIHGGFAAAIGASHVYSADPVELRPSQFSLQAARKGD